MMRRNLFKTALVVLALGLFAMPCELHAQTVPATQQEAQAILKEKGISESELRQRMLDKGYDIDNIEPARISEVQRVLTETIAELEAEKAAEKALDEKTATEETPPLEQTPKKATVVEPPVEEEKTAKTTPSEPAAEKGEAKIYGHHLFRGKEAHVAKSNEAIQPPDWYVLGSKDELTVYINGATVITQAAEVDNNGFFQIKGAPPIPVGGLSVSQAREILRRTYHAYFQYVDSQFDLTIRSARQISVNVYGEARKRGGITISAVNTLFNALVTVEGPTDIGSVRGIKLIRGSEERIFDLYEFMQDPKTAKDFYLQENDYIQIPVAKRVVSIMGAINRPFRYELKEDEHLTDLIAYAGGLSADAFQRDIQITRFQNDQRVVINVNLRNILDSGGDYLLVPGDEVLIKNIDDAVENFVSLRGAVEKPGRYERKPDMRISDLITLGGMKSFARRDFAYVLRYNANGTYGFLRFSPENVFSNPSSTDNIQLENRDVVQIASLTTYTDSVQFSVTGSVRQPGQFNFDPSGTMRLQDAIEISGGLLPSAAEVGYVVRQNPRDPKRTEYLTFNAHTATEDATSSDNLEVLPNDSVFIFDKNALRDEFYIEIRGAVRNPGRYPYDVNLDLNEALKLAGGLTFSAASNRIDIARVIIRDNVPTRTANYTTTVDRDLVMTTGDSSIALLPFDQILVREVPEFELQRNVFLAGEVAYPGQYPIIGENERVVSFVERAGGLTPEAFTGGARLVRAADDVGVVIIDFEEAMSNVQSAANLVLQDGDTLYVPKVQELVSISGGVNLKDLYSTQFIEAGNKINVTFEQGKNALYYINKYAAGVSEDGRLRLVTVVHANGRVEKTTNLGLFKIYPKVTKGASINVGRVAEKERIIREQSEEPVDWGAIVRDSLAQATAILTLILLLERLN